MKRAIVSGATGFVGSNLTRRLLREGHEVHLLVRQDHNPWRIASILGEVHLHCVDFADVEGLTRLVCSIRPDWIFHLAAYGAYSWQTEIASIISTNITGTINLVSSSIKAGFEAFIHTGSSSEYGFKHSPPAENEWLDPNSYYAAAKASATMFCRYAARSEKANITTLRLYSVYGPYEDPNRLIPSLIRHGLKGELPPLVSPNTARDYVYVDDICDACILTAQMPPREFGAVYNVGTGIQRTIAEVVELASRRMKLTVEPKWGSMAPRIWDADVWVANNQKIREELGWTPSHSFKRGLEATIEWYRSHEWALHPTELLRRAS